MSDFSYWEALNLICRLGISAVCVAKLWLYFGAYKPSERIGIGIAGGCSLMSVGVLFEGSQSPFAEWATALFAFGILLYITGRLERQIRHERANREHLARRTRT